MMRPPEGERPAAKARKRRRPAPRPSTGRCVNCGDPVESEVGSDWVHVRTQKYHCNLRGKSPSVAAVLRG